MTETKETTYEHTRQGCSYCNLNDPECEYSCPLEGSTYEEEEKDATARPTSTPEHG